MNTLLDNIRYHVKHRFKKKQFEMGVNLIETPEQGEQLLEQICAEIAAD